MLIIRAFPVPDPDFGLSSRKDLGYYEAGRHPFPSGGWKFPDRRAPGRPLSSSHHLSLPEDPFPGLLPAFLLVIGSLFGGVRALLSSPIRTTLAAGLPEKWQERLESAADPEKRLHTAAGLMRMFCLIGAVVILLQQAEGRSPFFQGVFFTTAVIFGGIMLEGVPALIQRGRGRRMVLQLLPLVRIGAVLLSPVTMLIQRTLSNFATPQNHERNQDLAAELTEVAHLHARTDSLGPSERKMIGHLLELPETDAAEVMTPRTGLTAIATSASVAEALEMAATEGHSRIPVFEEDFDHIKGLFHIKDVLAAIANGDPVASDSVTQHMREAFFVPETVRLPSLFEDMRRRRAHLAIVVDEYGGTAGVVTIEDLLEEIVGEIEDEHESLEDQPKIYSASDEEIIADGGVCIDLLNEEFDAELPEDESYETLAGLIFDRLGYVPNQGDSLPLESGVLEVLEADDRRIRKVRLRRPSDQQESDAA